jgi:hypothetical protein
MKASRSEAARDAVRADGRAAGGAKTEGRGKWIATAAEY